MNSVINLIIVKLKMKRKINTMKLNLALYRKRLSRMNECLKNMEKQLKYTIQVDKILQNTQTNKSKQIDYEKNIPNYILKRCLKKMFGRTYQRMVHKLCKQKGIQIKELQTEYKHWLKYSTIGLGDYDILTKTQKGSQIFHLVLKKQVYFELINSGKIRYPQPYIKRKIELLYLAQNAKHPRFIEKTNFQSIKMGEHY